MSSNDDELVALLD